MAFLSDKTLKPILEKAIVPFNRDRLKDASYELSLGAEYYQTGDKIKTAIPVKENEQISLSPGQFALLITEETVNIPTNCLAFISIKAKVKFNGLVNVSGFHVDPGYKGRLIFSVFNAGAKNVILRRGEPLFLIWFAKLDQENEAYRGKGFQNIDSNLITTIDSEVTSNPVLKAKIDSIEASLKSKIDGLENQAKYLTWILVTLVVAGIGILIKIWLDSKPFEKTVTIEEYNANLDRHLQGVKIDSIVEAKVNDRLEELNADTTKAELQNGK